MKTEIYCRIGSAENEAETKPQERITVKCYGKTEIWDSREKAEAFYFECMTMSEGSERDRYTKIYTELKLGMLQCTDEE